MNIETKKAMGMYLALYILLGVVGSFGLIILLVKIIYIGYEPKDAGLIAICSLAILGCARLYAKIRAELFH